MEGKTDIIITTWQLILAHLYLSLVEFLKSKGNIPQMSAIGLYQIFFTGDFLFITICDLEKHTTSYSCSPSRVSKS